MDTLDRDRLRELISTLELAHQMGFSSPSSSIDFLFEALSDGMLLLKSVYLEGKRALSNREPRFLDAEKPNALGNSKSIRLPRRKSEYLLFADPFAEELFYSLASLLRSIKEGTPLSASFMEALRKESFHRPLRKVGALDRKLNKIEKDYKRKNSAKVRKTLNFYRGTSDAKVKSYYRRRRKKSNH